MDALVAFRGMKGKIVSTALSIIKGVAVAAPISIGLTVAANQIVSSAVDDPAERETVTFSNGETRTIKRRTEVHGFEGEHNRFALTLVAGIGVGMTGLIASSATNLGPFGRAVGLTLGIGGIAACVAGFMGLSKDY